MGYRSDVASMIYGDGSTEDNDKIAALWMRAQLAGLLKSLTQSPDQPMVKQIAIRDYKQDKIAALYLNEESIKWYEDYQFVKDWNEIMRLAQTEYQLNTEFVRIGEDMEDIVRDSEGDNVQSFLYVSRTISEDFTSEEELACDQMATATE